jgi:hypothetical protein
LNACIGQTRYYEENEDGKLMPPTLSFRMNERYVYEFKELYNDFKKRFELPIDVFKAILFHYCRNKPSVEFIGFIDGIESRRITTVEYFEIAGVIKKSMLCHHFFVNRSNDSPSGQYINENLYKQ